MSRISPSRLAVLVVVGVVAIQALMLLAFSWPASNTEPRELPIGIAGPPEAAEEVAAGFETMSTPNNTQPFDIHTFDDRDAAEQAIRERDIYGALVVSPEGQELLVASGAGPAVAQALQQGLAANTEGEPPPVDDIVPADPDDPNGAGLASSVLPLVITSAAGGAIVALFIRGGWRRVMTILALAIGAGFAAAALMQYVVGIGDGPYLELSAAMAVIVGAIVGGVAGLGSLLGRAGIGLGMLVVLFVGNPLSAATSAPEMLPQPWGEIGQFLPPGAGVSAVRSVVFFDNEALLQPGIVLGSWLIGGLLLVLIGTAIRNRMDYDLDDDVEVSEPAHAI